MANYFTSAQVKNSFPSTYRTYDTSKSKFTSEQNFTNILNSLVDKSSFQSGDDGFVLDYSGGTSGSGTLKVIIHGYYFEIDNYSPSKNTSVLEIRVADTAEYLANYGDSSTTLDVSGKFQGLAYSNAPTTTPASGYKYYHVHVCDDRGNITNKARLVSDSIIYSGNKTSQSLTKELEAKQYNLKNGQGIADISNNQGGGNVVKLTDEEMTKLNSLETTDTTGRRLVYFKKNSAGIQGCATNSTENAGYKLTTSSGSPSYYCEQGMYINNGTIQNGFTIWAGNSSTKPSAANVGDIYFKYQ